MEQLIFLNGKQVEVIAYFEFEATRNHYLIYSNQGSDTIYLGSVIKKDDVFEINSIEKSQSFLLKKFIKELINKDLATVKCYRYFNKLDELQDNFTYRGSQEIVLDTEKKKLLCEFINEVNEHNGEILDRAKDEYYMQLVDQKQKERRTIITLLIVLVVVIGLIAKMIIGYINMF